MDFSLLHALNDLAARSSWVEQLFRFFAVDGVALFLAALLVLSLPSGRLANATGRRASAAAAASAGLALLVAQVVGHLWDRARPYEAHAGAVKLFLAPSADPSFPSDHATGAFAVAVAVLLYHRRFGAGLVALAVAVAVSRVALGTHYPTDVVAGAVLGSAAAALVHVAALRVRLERLADGVGAIYDRLLAWRPGPAGRADAR